MRVFTAGFLGFLIGMLNKSVYDQPFARLFSIICMASCLLTVTSMEFFKMLDLPWVADPGRLSAQVLSALGFLGTGLLWISRDNKIRGLSVGASMWFTAILGMMVGIALNLIAIIGLAFLVSVYCLSNRVADWKHEQRKSRG